MSSRIERANAIRTLALDAVDRANSGHAGAPMGMADIAEVLWREVLRHNPANPEWWDRDRFVLSNGHGSMLLYALLHLTGYALGTDDLKAFRQLHSKTPGHPEYRETPGVETTTGPLGQGFANAVGLAIAERVLAARFNQPNLAIVDHRTWVFLGDGCLMEGISHEVASLAGFKRLIPLSAPSIAVLCIVRSTICRRSDLRSIPMAASIAPSVSFKHSNCFQMGRMPPPLSGSLATRRDFTSRPV